MKTISSFGLLRLFSACILLSLFPQARALDFGVDPNNLRKGDWIYFLSDATNKLGGNVLSVTNAASLFAYEKSQGMDYIVIKAGTGSTNFPSAGNPQFTASLVTAAHNAGLKIFAYDRSYGTDIPGEIALATNCLNLGADGFVIDAEAEWEGLANNATAATNLLRGIKNVFPNRFLGHSPFMYISFHSSFPYKQFGLFCDAVMPQAYWHEFGITASACVTDMNNEWNNWQNSLTGSWTNAIKPIAPIGQGWNGVTSAEITSFYNSVKNIANPATKGGYKSVSFWRADLHTADMWTSIGGNSIGVAPTNAPVISNVAAGNLAADRATITWTTDISSDSVVEFGLTVSYGASVTNTTQVANHSVDVTGLTATTLYHYRVKSKNAAGIQSVSGDFTFTSGAGVADITIDNPGATLTGTWSIGTGSTDKFGTDYRFKSGGTGAAFAQYVPNVVTAGDYDVYCWYPQGSNRTTNAPYVISYNGGSATVRVNQQVNGGQWNLLGRFNFVTGSSGNIKLTDNYSDSANVVMADAVKLVYAGNIVTPPSAPSGLSATAAGASQINLAWTDNSNNEDNFIVARSTVSGGPYSDIATLGANVTSYNNTGLASSSTYYYVVRASNSAGSSANSAQAGATTSAAAPTAPSGLSATTVSSSQINLAWTDNSSNENGFVVGRSTASGGPYTDVVTNSANVTAVNDSGLSANTTYYYVVRAYNAAGASANSTQASATTLPLPPASPSGLAATAVSSSQINLGWTDNSSNEANFIVARSTTSGGPYTDVATLGANTTSYSNTGLAGSTTYYYVVRASNTGGSSANSAQASATTFAPAPAAPSGLSASATSASQVNLAWTDNSSNESGFVVGRATVSGGPYADIVTNAANVTTFNNTGLSANTTYYYVVRAYNAAGASANSAQASATTLPLVPAAPSGLTAIAAGTTQIDLAWSDNSANETSFIVGRSTANGGPYTDVATLGANVVGYSDTGLNAATTYFYVVRASNSGGSSANSAQASATTDAPTTDIIVDNPAATVVGIWTTGTSAPDKFGSDYRYKGQGTGSAYLQFTPSIASAGSYQVYEWHSQGSNRSVGAPHVINYSGGSRTINVNQTVNGGIWSSLGIYSFAAGTAGNVRVTDGFSDASAVAIADAVRFVKLDPATVGHVANITMSWVASGAKFKSRAVVKILDGNGNPVTGVTVTGNFSGAINNSGLSAVTGSLGNATITSTSAINSGTVTFTVVSVGGTYDSTANVVNSATATR
jgi:hypothetical protein